MMLILANTITADMGLIPGLALAGPAMGLPLSVFASFLERPFVTLAGVRRNAIWYALQANLVSLLVGYIGLFVSAAIVDAFRLWGPNDPLFTIWPFVAVGISILVESLYLSIRAGAGRLRWGWIALANVLSAAACIGLLALVIYMRDQYVDLRLAITPYHGALNVFVAIGSIAMFVAAFAIPARSSVARSSGEPTAA